jgi:molecular chaperone DnaK (HSP70)
VHVQVTTTSDALLAAYLHKHPPNGEGRTVLIVEVGHSQCAVLVARVEADGKVLLLAKEADAALGAASFDHRLFAHFKAQLEGKYGGSIRAGEKRGLRLLAAVEKIRKHLSTIPEAHAQVRGRGLAEGKTPDWVAGWLVH